MKILVNEKLSTHRYKTPEGYLICTDAILARTGKQKYSRNELFNDGDSTEVEVDRPYNQVMNAKTIASFENKPVTFDHPDEDVNIGNYKDYAIGYVRDVRQGKTEKGENVIIGDLIITDQDAINAIESGDHTDLSCGYDCDIIEDGNGGYMQTNIRGNHVALCEQGRAGIARIVDSKMKDDNWYVIYEERFNNYYTGNGWTSSISNAKKYHSLEEAKQVIINYGITSNTQMTIMGSSGKTYAETVRGRLMSYDSKMKDENLLETIDRLQASSGVRNYTMKEGKNKNNGHHIIQYIFDRNNLIVYDKNKDEIIGLIENGKTKINKLHDAIIDNEIVDSKTKDDYSIKEIKEAVKKLLQQKPFLSYEEALQKVKENIKNGNYLLDNEIEDNDEWIIKNTGLAYEVWNGGKLIKKFATKKQAIEWIQDRFPTDEIVDSKVRDWTPEEVRQFKVERRGKGYGIYYKGQLVSKYDDYDEDEANLELQRLKKYYYVDSKVKDEEGAENMNIKVKDLDNTLKKLMKELIFNGANEELIYDISYWSGGKDWAVIDTESDYVRKLMDIIESRLRLFTSSGSNYVMVNIGYNGKFLDSKVEGSKVKDSIAYFDRDVIGRNELSEAAERFGLKYMESFDQHRVEGPLNKIQQLLRYLDINENSIEINNSKMKDAYYEMGKMGIDEDELKIDCGNLGLKCYNEGKYYKIEGDKGKIATLLSQYNMKSDWTNIRDTNSSYRGYELVHTRPEWQVWKNGKLLVKTPTDREAIMWIDDRINSGIKDSIKIAIKAINTLKRNKK